MTALRKTLLDYSLITIGSILTSVAIVSFMIPNNIIAGGVSGLAIILYRIFGFWVGAQMLVYNIFLFALAFVVLGIGFGIKSIYSAILMSLTVDIMQKLPFPYLDAASTQDGFLLAAIYGGVVAGVGMGLVLWRGASTGGTDIVAMILAKYFSFSTGSGLFISDSLITIFAIVVFGPIAAMYGIITIHDRQNYRRDHRGYRKHENGLRSECKQHRDKGQDNKRDGKGNHDDQSHRWIHRRRAARTDGFATTARNWPVETHSQSHRQKGLRHSGQQLRSLRRRLQKPQLNCV